MISWQSFWGRTHERTANKCIDMCPYLTYYFGVPLEVLPLHSLLTSPNPTLDSPNLLARLLWWTNRREEATDRDPQVHAAKHENPKLAPKNKQHLRLLPGVGPAARTCLCRNHKARLSIARTSRSNLGRLHGCAIINCMSYYIELRPEHSESSGRRSESLRRALSTSPTFRRHSSQYPCEFSEKEKCQGLIHICRKGAWLFVLQKHKQLLDIPEK